jgi:hypothetical protein
MESHELESEAPQGGEPLVEESEIESRRDGAHAVEGQESESQQGTGRNACAIDASEASAEEDETQLTAIRELMRRAFVRGVWLTLGEIAEATEFAEASISAQLRHLRKPRHGSHRVEKRRRLPGRAAAGARNIRAERKGPVIWEYCVLPKRWRGPGRAKSEAAPGAGAGAARYEKADSSGKGGPRNDSNSGGSAGGNDFAVPESTVGG